jgi:hypothetical protein
MAKNPQRAYQRPSPPPVYPLQRSGAPQQSGWQPPKPPKRRRKTLIAACGLILLALLAAFILKPSSSTQPPVSETPYSAAAIKPAASFQQNYRLTITEGAASATINKVQVKGLQSKQATIIYTITYSPKLTWPGQASSYLLKSGVLYQAKVSSRKVGPQRRAKISFTIPTKTALRAARLILQPSQRSPLQLGLEIPSSKYNPLKERSGPGAVQ